MTISIRKIVDSFEILFESLHTPAFAKSHDFKKRNERELLPITRWYLLGCFGYEVEPECLARLPGTPSGNGLIDFIIGGIAVEFAVRSPLAAKASINAVSQKTEVKKLMKYPGKSLLVIFDFTDKPYTHQEIDNFRIIPSCGKGNHKRSPFNIAYFYQNKNFAKDESMGIEKIYKNIRVN